MPDARVPPRWRAVLAILSALPTGALSRLVGHLARIEFPAGLQKRLNRAFVRLSGLDPRESERPPEAYRSLSSLFVRRLKPGLRSWPKDPSAIASPVDGVLGAFGRVDGGTLIQAKGRSYTVGALLDEEAVDRFGSGVFFTIYLSPRHYHRIHSPVSGRLTAARVVPGRLLPVNPPAVASVRDLFARNERLVAILEADSYELAVVAVGALNVGSISAAFDPDWGSGPGRGVTNRPGAGSDRRRDYDPPIEMRRADELMAFHLGSTVVLLVAAKESSAPIPHRDLRLGAEIRLGTPLLESN